MKISPTKPVIGKRELAAAARALKSGWIIRGPETEAFEKEFAAFSGAKYAVATNGCTMALYLVLKQLNLKPKDEIIVPSFTWSATASAVINAGATPVFADVLPDTWCLDPADVKRKITKKTRLVIPVHYAGRMAEGFSRFPIMVMYDSAHRIEPRDSSGVTSCYSFYAVKNMTTIRGGMILTNDASIAAYCLKAVHGGLTKDTRSRYKEATEKNDISSFYYEVEFPGFNFDMTDVEAAIGREQLKQVVKFNKKRNSVVKKYNKAFGLRNSGNHLYPILVEDRDTFLISMKQAGIRCGIHYLPLHQMKAYKKYRRGSLPVTEIIGKHCVSLPLHASMTQREINYVIRTVKKFANPVELL